MNCGSTDSQAFENQGILTLGRTARFQTLIACLDYLEHSGKLQLYSTNVTINRALTTPNGSIALEQSHILMNGSSLVSEGSLAGTGSIQGNLVNGKEATIQGFGENQPTRLHVSGQFRSIGTMIFNIQSRNQTDPNALTFISAGDDVNLEGGRACVCLNPDGNFEEGDRFELILSQTKRLGRFEEVLFNCKDECPIRNAKSVASYDRSCKPGASYGGVNFAILLGSCGSDDLTKRISPPWYVHFPVAVTIILLLIVFFGGALIIEQRLRKKEQATRHQERRDDRVSQLLEVAKRANQ